jgi:hypothetical protein
MTPGYVFAFGDAAEIVTEALERGIGVRTWDAQA